MKGFSLCTGLGLGSWCRGGLAGLPVPCMQRGALYAACVWAVHGPAARPSPTVLLLVLCALQLPPGLTSLVCDYSVCPDEDDSCWDALRHLKLTGLPGGDAHDQLPRVRVPRPGLPDGLWCARPSAPALPRAKALAYCWACPSASRPQALKYATRLTRLELCGRRVAEPGVVALTLADQRRLLEMASLRVLAVDLWAICACRSCGGTGCRELDWEVELPGVEVEARWDCRP